MLDVIVQKACYLNGVLQSPSATPIRVNTNCINVALAWGKGWIVGLDGETLYAK